MAIDPTFQQAVQYHHQGQLAQAQAVYEQILATQPRNADVLLRLGVIAAQMNDKTGAAVFFGRAIEADPGNPVPYNNRGLALHEMQRFQDALEHYERAIALKTDYADAHFNRGNVLLDLRRWQESLDSYDRVIALRPKHAAAHANRGVVLKDLKRLDEAIDSFDRVLAIRPDFTAAIVNRASALRLAGRFEAAVADYDRAIALRPDVFSIYNDRGLVLVHLNRPEAALASYDRALELNPQYDEAHMNRGVVLCRLQQFEAALASYDRAIELNPNYAAAHANRGIVLKELKASEAALASYDRAIALNPRSAEAHLNRAELFKDLKQWPRALADYDRAIAIDPAYAEAYYGRGETQRLLDRYGAAAASFKRAFALKPDMKYLLNTSLHVGMHLCDWDDFEANLARLTALVEGGEVACMPQPFSALCGSAALQRRAAEIWVQEECGPNDSLPPIPRYGRHEKIRVGYFSPDFHNHPVSALTAELYELHDRARFDVTAFSSGPDTQDPMRRRLQSAFDRFIDVSGRSDQEVARLARSMELDIAVDLGGFTGDARLKIFALRAAPLQVSYLGYLGTTAAPYMDYLIADAMIVPPELRCHYTERMLYLPSYQANDSKRRIADRVFSREELGLPPSGVVYCCFNANYKITPGTFDGWMRILQKVPGAVLLLYAGSEEVPGNLRQEARRRGVDPARLVFGQVLPGPEYLARYRAADLFLDTLPYNAGTTASDALWAGLPVLTCLGEAFASRVAGSLLLAIGLPELITHSQGEYEELAIALGRDPERLALIKQRLTANRLSTPLFDSGAFTQNLEAAYQRIYERNRADLPLEDVHAGFES